VNSAAFLVTAASNAGPRRAPPPALPPWWNVYGRLGRMIEILERLERREHELSTRARTTARSSMEAANA
jgi:hypothetical protein